MITRAVRWGGFLLAVLAVIFCPLWYFIRPEAPADRIAFASLVILTASGVVLAWYTWETRQLRRATLRQTDLLIRPFLALEYDHASRAIRLHNIGRPPVARGNRDRPAYPRRADPACGG
jgi:hypothetical protein